MEASNQNPYDFILNTDPAQKKPPVDLSKQSNKILAITGLLAVVVVIVLILVSLVFSQGDIGKKLTTVYSQQSEIVRVLELGLKNTTDQTIKQKLTTLHISILSDQQAVGSIIEKKELQPLKPTTQELEDRKKIDSKLESAKASGDYDKVFYETVSSLISTYQKGIKDAQASASKNDKATLSTAVNSIQIIAEDK